MIDATARTEPHDRGGVAGLARGGAANLTGAGFAGAAGFVVTWLVARGLGPEGAGVFFAAVAGFVLVAGVAKLGTPTGLVYWPARLRAQHRPDLAAACLRAGLPPVAVAATGLAVAVWVTAPWLGAAITTGPEPAAAATAGLRALAPFLPLAALAEAALAATRSHRLMRPTVVLDKLLRPALQLVGLAALATVAIWAAVPPTAWPLVWALPYLPVALLAGYALHRLEPLHRLPHQPGLARMFWRFTGPRAVAAGLHLALQRVDILLVAGLAGPAQAAIYTVAGRFVVLGQLANQAIGNAVQPRLAERLGAGDLAGTQALYRTATAWLVLVSWPLYLLVGVYAPVYLGLFGEPYRSGGQVVVVLAAAMLLASGCGAVDMLLAMAGRTSWNLANVSLALTVMVGLDVMLIPQMGAVGAAIGLAAAIAINNLLPLAQVVQALGIHPFGPGTLTAAGLATLCFGVLPGACAAVAGTTPTTVAATVAGSTLLYAAGLRRFRRQLALAALVAAGSPRRNGDIHAR